MTCGIMSLIHLTKYWTTASNLELVYSVIISVKSLIFTPLAQYFNDFAIKDWTEKIDYSRDYHIEPITFHNKYILFNYDKYETELSKKYNEKYGLNYGEYKLSTDYEFNNDVNSLFKFGKISIPTTDTLLSWGNIHDNLSVVYTLTSRNIYWHER